MAKVTPAGGNESSAGGRPDEVVLDYLRNAPDELQPWARKKLEELSSVDASSADVSRQAIDDDVAGPASASAAVEGEMSADDEPTKQETTSDQDLASRAVEAGLLEENDLALAELGEMDEQQQRAVRRARKRSRRGHATAPNADSKGGLDTAETRIETPAAREPGAPSWEKMDSLSNAGFAPKSEKKSKWFTVLIVAALSMGLAFGVFMIGSDDQKPITPNQLPDGHPDISQMDQSLAPPVDNSERLFELDMAVRQNPDDWESRLEMGVLLMNQRDFAEAEEQWLAVLDGAQGHAEAYYNLGFLYTTMDPPDLDKAIESWEKLMELDPNSELAQDVKPFYDTLLSGPPKETP